MDQRKVNMLAREYCDMTRPKIRHKPIILSHHMIMGLKKDQEKMSKSDPDSAIFMEDSVADVKRKIRSAYCPEGDEDFEKNPVIDYIRHIVFGYYGYFELYDQNEAMIQKYDDFERFAADYKSKELHPSVVKPSLARAINQIIEPVRNHFEKVPEAKELLEKVKKYRITK
jgi:tyrosyl-tRNA synthetase